MIPQNGFRKNKSRPLVPRSLKLKAEVRNKNKNLFLFNLAISEHPFLYFSHHKANLRDHRSPNLSGAIPWGVPRSSSRCQAVTDSAKEAENPPLRMCSLFFTLNSLLTCPTLMVSLSLSPVQDPPVYFSSFSRPSDHSSRHSHSATMASHVPRQHIALPPEIEHPPSKFQEQPLPSASQQQQQNLTAVDALDNVAKGLTNNVGEHNCFLNGVLQILWHCKSFHTFIATREHTCLGDLSCLFCQLKV